MKLEIYGETEPQETEPQETVVKLRLLPDEFDDDTVGVIAVDRNGNRVSCDSLITFKRSGKVQLNPDVNPGLGFNLDSNGRLIIKGRD